MSQIQEQILFQAEVAPNAYLAFGPAYVFNTGNNHTILVGEDFNLANNFNLLNLRAFATDTPIENADFTLINSSIRSTAESLGEQRTPIDNTAEEFTYNIDYIFMADDIPNTIPVSEATGKLSQTVQAALWGQDETAIETPGMVPGAQFYTYLINGLNVYRLSNPSEGNEIYSANSITRYGENSTAEFIFSLEPKTSYVPFENTLAYLFQNELNETINELNDVYDLYIQADDGISASDLTAVNNLLNDSENLVSELQLQIKALQQENENLQISIDSVIPDDGIGQSDVDLAYQQGVDSVIPDDGIGQDDVDLAYQQGVASVFPEDGINQTDVDLAYQQGIASVDITSDNQQVADEAYGLGYSDGISSVLPPDLQGSYNEGYSQGVASVTPEDGIGQSNVDLAYQQGLSSGYNQGYQEAANILDELQQNIDNIKYVYVKETVKKDELKPKPIVILGILAGGILLLSKSSK